MVTRNTFNHNLEKLYHEIIKMGSLVEESIEKRKLKNFYILNLYNIYVTIVEKDYANKFN